MENGVDIVPHEQLLGGAETHFRLTLGILEHKRNLSRLAVDDNAAGIVRLLRDDLQGLPHGHSQIGSRSGERCDRTDLDAFLALRSRRGAERQSERTARRHQ
jgi:hypothetical protein